MNSIIAMTNANFLEKKVSSVAQFINESYCTVSVSLCKPCATPRKQILMAMKKKTHKNSKVRANKKKDYEPQLCLPVDTVFGELF